MEELVLTDPIVEPEKVTNKYRVVALTLDMEVVAGVPGTPPGLVAIKLRDNYDVPSSYQYIGPEAVTMIKTLNTANLTTKSLHKRVLEKLSNDGKLPGTVTGTPDPL